MSMLRFLDIVILGLQATLMVWGFMGELTPFQAGMGWFMALLYNIGYTFFLRKKVDKL